MKQTAKTAVLVQENSNKGKTLSDNYLKKKLPLNSIVPNFSSRNILLNPTARVYSSVVRSLQYSLASYNLAVRGIKKDIKKSSAITLQCVVI